MRLFRRNPSGRACAGAPMRFSSLIWNNQTVLAKAATEHPAQTRRASDYSIRGSLEIRQYLRRGLAELTVECHQRRAQFQRQLKVGGVVCGEPGAFGQLELGAGIDAAAGEAQRIEIGQCLLGKLAVAGSGFLQSDAD